jgi:hypothetical protein
MTFVGYDTSVGRILREHDCVYEPRGVRAWNDNNEPIIVLRIVTCDSMTESVRKKLRQLHPNVKFVADEQRLYIPETLVVPSDTTFGFTRVELAIGTVALAIAALTASSIASAQLT